MPAKPRDDPPAVDASSDDAAALRPFADESVVLGVGDLAIENRVDRVTLAGSVELTRDRRGLALARTLKAALDAVVAALDADARVGRLPPRVASRRARSVANPFDERTGRPR